MQRFVETKAHLCVRPNSACGWHNFFLPHRHTQHQSIINIQGLLQAGFNIVYHRNDHFTSSNISSQLSGSSIKHQFILLLCGPHQKFFCPISASDIFYHHLKSWQAYSIHLLASQSSLMTHKMFFLVSPKDLLQHYQHQ